MSQLDLDGDMLRTFLDAESGFAESIEYHNEGGDPARTINAIVDRNPPAVIGEDKRNLAPLLVVTVANDATSGIASTEINLGGDRLNLPVREGKTAELREIAKIRRQDAGMLELEVN